MKDLCIRESYKDKNGEDKVSWNKIGVLIESKGKQYIKLFHIPGVLISVFEPRKKEDRPAETAPAENPNWLDEETPNA